MARGALPASLRKERLRPQSKGLWRMRGLHILPQNQVTRAGGPPWVFRSQRAAPSSALTVERTGNGDITAREVGRRAAKHSRMWKTMGSQWVGGVTGRFNHQETHQGPQALTRSSARAEALTSPGSQHRRGPPSPIPPGGRSPGPPSACPFPGDTGDLETPCLHGQEASAHLGPLLPHLQSQDLGSRSPAL